MARFDTLPGLQLRYVAALQQDPPGANPGTGLRQQSHDRKRGHALSTTGLADETKDLALGQAEGHARDDVDRSGFRPH